MTQPNPTNYLDLTTRITRDGVYFGDEKLPGIIAQDGVTLRPGGADDINRLTVEFLVGPVECTDPLVEQRHMNLEATTITDYSCRAAARPNAE